MSITQPNLLIVQMLFAPERALDLPAQLFPRTREPARDARLMLVHYPADFLKSEFLDVVELEPHPISRLEQSECGFECLSEGFDINGAVGLRRIGRRVCFILQSRRPAVPSVARLARSRPIVARAPRATTSSTNCARGSSSAASGGHVPRGRRGRHKANPQVHARVIRRGSAHVPPRTGPRDNS